MKSTNQTYEKEFGASSLLVCQMEFIWSEGEKGLYILQGVKGLRETQKFCDYFQ